MLSHIIIDVFMIFFLKLMAYREQLSDALQQPSGGFITLQPGAGKDSGKKFFCNREIHIQHAVCGCVHLPWSIKKSLKAKTSSLLQSRSHFKVN